VQVATQKQIDANRRNAQLSTGPKSEEGKRAAHDLQLPQNLTDTRAGEAAGDVREEDLSNS
jgi:hypothetical protein